MIVVPISERGENLFLPVMYIVGVLYIQMYHFLPKVTFVDELVALLLLFWGSKKYQIYKDKSFLLPFGVLGFFLIYSLLFGINVKEAIILDFISFVKPLSCFYITLLIPFSLTHGQRLLIKKFLFFSCIFCLAQIPFLNHIYFNTSFYYRVCIFCSMSYLYFSDFERKDILFCTLVLVGGLASFRAKFVGEFIFFIYIFYWLKNKVSINVGFVVISIILLFLSIYLNWEKFEHYFFATEDDGVARTLFYMHSVDVLKENFLFGPGFGSYNTEGAARYYSPLYHHFGFDRVWGLSQDSYRTDHDFLHDTFYPALFQFGCVGFFLFFIFWKKIWMFGKIIENKSYNIFLFLFVVSLVENMAANSFTSLYTVPIMMQIGFILNEENNNNIFKDV